MTRALLVWCALCVGACTTERMVGSTCPEGMCEMAPASTPTACLIATGDAVLQTLPTAPGDICVVDRVHKDEDDMAPCRMLISIREDQSCEGVGLQAALDAPVVGANVCEMPQLERASRGVIGMTATGWFIDGTELLAGDTCAPIASHHARFNGALPSDNAPRLVCADAFADPTTISAALRPQDVLQVDPESCAGLPPLPESMPRVVGSVCSARFEPPGGFFTDRTYIDARSEQCETGVCLIDATRSERRWPCSQGDSDCYDAGAPDLSTLTYCSCRCDAKGDPSRVACECPSGFTCRDVLSNEAPSTLAGGYCTRESAF